uniref:Uncharacterized protein n=1 Tax=Arundo donax TaxID=35708 RepID=A0A0A9FE67_ARUDO
MIYRRDWRSNDDIRPSSFPQNHIETIKNRWQRDQQICCTYLSMHF